MSKSLGTLMENYGCGGWTRGVCVCVCVNRPAKTRRLRAKRKKKAICIKGQHACKKTTAVDRQVGNRAQQLWSDDEKQRAASFLWQSPKNLMQATKSTLGLKDKLWLMQLCSITIEEDSLCKGGGDLGGAGGRGGKFSARKTERWD